MGAGHPKIGDTIKQADGTTGLVANGTTVQQTREMFNLTVSEAHTYYVGQEGWLVHNANGSCGLTFLGTKNAGTGNATSIFSYGGKQIELGTNHAWNQSKHLLEGTGLTAGQIEQTIV
ncbi:polymorphic toxin-type HINT domain-containing protein [Deinococcus kurensis]|uniref:polymorphic toxin-type HINT domain-containing protein n=1 Tax=Deinococcus kurensis TaxID=2662757 RepID=UPI001F402264|nr:polymorphic toxin-type HINT domain-containing protein [Deinococcus kurensis]